MNTWQIMATDRHSTQDGHRVHWGQAWGAEGRAPSQLAAPHLPTGLSLSAHRGTGDTCRDLLPAQGGLSPSSVFRLFLGSSCPVPWSLLRSLILRASGDHRNLPETPGGTVAPAGSFPATGHLLDSQMEPEFRFQERCVLVAGLETKTHREETPNRR